MHIIIGSFYAIETLNKKLVKNITNILEKYGLKKNIIADLKDEGSNFNSTITPFKYVVNLENFSS
jgi:hypothetical protein